MYMQRAGLLDGKATVVSRARDDTNARALELFNEPVEAHPSPLLGRIEPTCAVEGRSDAVVERRHILVGQRSTAHPQGPGCGVDARNRIEHPRADGHEVGPQRARFI